MLEEGMLSVKEGLMEVIAVTGVRLNKGFRLRICRVILSRDMGSRKHLEGNYLTFRALLAHSGVTERAV